MTPTFFEQDDPEEIGRLCLYLFDRWCEHRSVIPLVYLMHAWPILSATRYAMTRLRENLQELLRFHPDALSKEDRHMINRILTISGREPATQE